MSVRASMDNRNPTRSNVQSSLINAGAGSIGIKTPLSKNMDAAYASATAFRISTDKGIPNKSSIRSLARNRERLESLMNLPMHKTGTLKFDGDPNRRTIAPLTKEDTTNFANMSLMSTLRAGKSYNSSKAGGGNTIENPPSFYEDDLNKWKNKFAKAVSARA